MRRIDDKWLVRMFVLALIVVAAAALLMDLAKLVDVVVGLLIVGLAASWILALLRRKETIRSLPGIVALALLWSAGLVALFAWLDTPPSRYGAEPAGFVPNGTGRIAFSDNGSIYAINADGTGQTALTGDELDGTLPAWSPGGDRLALVSDGEI